MSSIEEHVGRLAGVVLNLNTGDVLPAMSCMELDALADLLDEAGFHEAAEHARVEHARSDSDEEDEHHTLWLANWCGLEE